MATHQELWNQTTGNLQSDIYIPMSVIREQSHTISKNWINGFCELFFDGVKISDTGVVDLSQTMTPKMIQIQYDQSTADGKSQEAGSKTIEVPLMSVIDFPGLAIEDVTIDLHYTVGTNQNDTSNTSVDAGGGGSISGGFLFGGFNASVSFSAGSSSAQTREEDTRAKIDMTCRYERQPRSEGCSRLIEKMLEKMPPVAKNKEPEKAAK